MNYKPENLKPGKVFHIYNRGNNHGEIFFDKGNYYYFLKLYQKYISPIADTYAFCLLKNHLHLLVYIKNQDEIQLKSLRYTTVAKPKVINASRQFSHLFNAYTQAINKRYRRSGSLFENPFRRKCTFSDKYMQELVYYIHYNPVNHGFAEQISDYRWSSYKMTMTDKPSIVKREFVLSAFGDQNAFIDFHKQDQKLTKITKFIIE